MYHLDRCLNDRTDQLFICVYVNFNVEIFNIYLKMICITCHIFLFFQFLSVWVFIPENFSQRITYLANCVNISKSFVCVKLVVFLYFLFFLYLMMYTYMRILWSTRNFGNCKSIFKKVKLILSYWPEDMYLHVCKMLVAST